MSSARLDDFRSHHSTFEKMWAPVETRTVQRRDVIPPPENRNMSHWFLSVLFSFWGAAAAAAKKTSWPLERWLIATLCSRKTKEKKKNKNNFATQKQMLRRRQRLLSGIISLYLTSVEQAKKRRHDDWVVTKTPNFLFFLCVCLFGFIFKKQWGKEKGGGKAAWFLSLSAKLKKMKRKKNKTRLDMQSISRLHISMETDAREREKGERQLDPKRNVINASYERRHRWWWRRRRRRRRLYE